VTPKLYKASDVCEMTGLQPYVLRSWEKEFPGIGVQKSPETVRLYRQSDVDQVARIKQLVFAEGLTVAGARRRLEAAAPVILPDTEAEMAEVLDTLGADARARIVAVRGGLRSILEALSRAPGVVEIAELTVIAEAEGTNGNRGARRGGPAGAHSAKADRKPKRKVVAAAKRTVASKRAAARKPARPAKRKSARSRF
jgi:DNA-binding transcriptional MerR regulator